MHKVVRECVAIKVLSKQFLNDEKTKQKLMREVSILKQLRHKNVVKLYETFENETNFFVAMELCSGGDLLGYVRK
jgi:serine/threonine protein kinase